jgi:hypothetical protein
LANNHTERRELVPAREQVQGTAVRSDYLDFSKNGKTQKKPLDISQTLWDNKPRRNEMDEPKRRERLGRNPGTFGKGSKSS